MSMKFITGQLAASTTQPFDDVNIKDSDTAMIEIGIMLVGSYLLGLFTYWLIHRFTHRHTKRAHVGLPMRKAKQPKGDDLTTLEGIGPRISEILRNAGVESFADLARMSRSEVKEILDNAGPRYQMFEPNGWIEQAKLAAEGKNEELEALKKRLVAGR